MQYEEVCWYSSRLEKDMRIKIYGHYGVPIIAFPCQGKKSDDFYNYGMIDNLADYINDGRIKLYCVDSADEDSVSSTSWDKRVRAYKLNMYHEYIIKEVLPFVYQKQGSYCEPLLIGASMGGSHAANNFFRRPEMFSGFISLSGGFDMSVFFDGYMDENVYNNSPVHYLSNMPNDHFYIDVYNQKMMCVVVGDGNFEYLVKGTNLWLEDIARQKGINIWFNFWDTNSTHDWPSWKYQMRYFLAHIL